MKPPLRRFLVMPLAFGDEPHVNKTVTVIVSSVLIGIAYSLSLFLVLLHFDERMYLIQSLLVYVYLLTDLSRSCQANLTQSLLSIQYPCTVQCSYQYSLSGLAALGSSRDPMPEFLRRVCVPLHFMRTMAILTRCQRSSWER
jgi:hypothetical protein